MGLTTDGTVLHRRQRIAVEPQPRQEFARNMLGIGGAAAISGEQ
jgi:hypothetical protein